MSHEHKPGWGICDICGLQYPNNCEVCLAVHVRNHHRKRRRRIMKAARR
jgi:hypothetical protein